MNKQTWIEHLSSWKQFLLERLADVDDKGDQIKIRRQLRTLERVRCGAVLNPKLLTEFINPDTRSENILACSQFSLDLNESQKIAVQTALGGDELVLIQGPPGTGKTQVIAEICLQLYQRNPGIRILVCSETHVAVNNLVSRIAKQNDQIRIVRIRDKESDDTIDTFSPETLVSDYITWASTCIQNKDAVKIIADELKDSLDLTLEKALALSANVAGMTCNRVAAYDFRDSTEMFDVAIIDEVCKATLPEILAPLLIARKAILLGDPKQLPPVFCTEERNIIRKLEGCKLDRYMYIDGLFNNSGNSLMLDTQYRMSNKIGRMISDLFYDGQLKNGRNEETENPVMWIDYKPSQQWPTIQEENSEKPQIYNEDECSIIANIIDKMVKSTLDLKIGIISPYKAQVHLLKDRIIQSENIKIDTVDGFQGKECDVIIFSVTRTCGSYRFLADKRRINVALSRARDKIIIVGNTEYAEGSDLLTKLKAYCETKTVDEL